MYHREVLQTPLRRLAAQIGISKSAVDKFHKDGVRPGKNWPRLRDWYMATSQTRARDQYQTPPQLMVDTVLFSVSGLPLDRRAAALRTLVKDHREFYAGLPTPEWLDILADIVDREGN